MRVAVLLTTLALIGGGPGRAEEADMHALFEARCQSCHGHSGAFARQTLAFEGDTVLGSRGQPLVGFLGRHQGGLSEADTQRMLDMFRVQILSDARFSQSCRTCHDTARQLARLHLFLRNGVLVGRYNGRPVEPFLVGHAGLDATEAAWMTEALTAILQGAR